MGLYIDRRITVSDDIYKDVCRKIVPVVNLAVSIGAARDRSPCAVEVRVSID